MKARCKHAMRSSKSFHYKACSLQNKLHLAIDSTNGKDGMEAVFRKSISKNSIHYNEINSIPFPTKNYNQFSHCCLLSALTLALSPTWLSPELSPLLLPDWDRAATITIANCPGARGTAECKWEEGRGWRGRGRQREGSGKWWGQIAVGQVTGPAGSMGKQGLGVLTTCFPWYSGKGVQI